MGACILALYRSAVQPKMTEWADEYAAVDHPPTLVVIAADDTYVGGEVLARRTAERWGAEVAVLDGPRPLVDDAGPGRRGSDAAHVPHRLTLDGWTNGVWTSGG